MASEMGSYPKWSMGNAVSIRDKARVQLQKFQLTLLLRQAQ